MSKQCLFIRFPEQRNLARITLKSSGATGPNRWGEKDAQIGNASAGYLYG